jgi:hypothetical protein
MTIFGVGQAKALWVKDLPSGRYDKDVLAELVEADHDEAETAYYESFADPTNLQNERARRRYRGMFRRRIRHLAARRKTRTAPAQSCD